MKFKFYSLSDIILSSNFWVHFHISSKDAGVKGLVWQIPCLMDALVWDYGALSDPTWSGEPATGFEPQLFLSAQLFSARDTLIHWHVAPSLGRLTGPCRGTKAQGANWVHVLRIGVWPTMQYSGPWPADLGSLPGRTGKGGGWPSWTSGVFFQHFFTV